MDIHNTSLLCFSDCFCPPRLRAIAAFPSGGASDTSLLTGKEGVTGGPGMKKGWGRWPKLAGSQACHLPSLAPVSSAITDTALSPPPCLSAMGNHGDFNSWQTLPQGGRGAASEPLCFGDSKVTLVSDSGCLPPWPLQSPGSPNFPSGPGVKTLCFQCKGLRFDPWLGK